MKRATLAVRKYRHSKAHPYYLGLRAFKQGRKFFRTRVEPEAKRMRQLTLRERGGRNAIGLPLNELSTIVEARKKVAPRGKGLPMRWRIISTTWNALNDAISSRATHRRVAGGEAQRRSINNLFEKTYATG